LATGLQHSRCPNKPTPPQRDGLGVAELLAYPAAQLFIETAREVAKPLAKRQ